MHQVSNVNIVTKVAKKVNICNFSLFFVFTGILEWTFIYALGFNMILSYLDYFAKIS